MWWWEFPRQETARTCVQRLQKARQRKAFTVGLTGRNGGHMASLADVCIRVPSTDPARIQEAHILYGHMLCEWVELATCVRQAIAGGRGAYGPGAA